MDLLRIAARIMVSSSVSIDIDDMFGEIRDILEKSTSHSFSTDENNEYTYSNHYYGYEFSYHIHFADGGSKGKFIELTVKNKENSDDPIIYFNLSDAAIGDIGFYKGFESCYYPVSSHDFVSSVEVDISSVNPFLFPRLFDEAIAEYIIDSLPYPSIKEGMENDFNRAVLQSVTEFVSSVVDNSGNGILSPEIVQELVSDLNGAVMSEIKFGKTYTDPLFGSAINPYKVNRSFAKKCIQDFFNDDGIKESIIHSVLDPVFDAFPESYEDFKAHIRSLAQLLKLGFCLLVNYMDLFRIASRIYDEGAVTPNPLSMFIDYINKHPDEDNRFEYSHISDSFYFKIKINQDNSINCSGYNGFLAFKFEHDFTQSSTTMTASIPNFNISGTFNDFYDFIDSVDKAKVLDLIRKVTKEGGEYWAECARIFKYKFWEALFHEDAGVRNKSISWLADHMVPTFNIYGIHDSTFIVGEDKIDKVRDILYEHLENFDPNNYISPSKFDPKITHEFLIKIVSAMVDAETVKEYFLSNYSEFIKSIGPTYKKFLSIKRMRQYDKEKLKPKPMSYQSDIDADDFLF